MFNSLRVFLELEGPRLNILQFTGNHEDKVDAKEMEAMFMMYMDVSTEDFNAWDFRTFLRAMRMLGHMTVVYNCKKVYQGVKRTQGWRNVIDAAFPWEG